MYWYTTRGKGFAECCSSTNTTVHVRVPVWVSGVARTVGHLDYNMVLLKKGVVGHIDSTGRGVAGSLYTVPTYFTASDYIISRGSVSKYYEVNLLTMVVLLL